MSIIKKFNKEFFDMVNDIMYLAIKVALPFERARVMEWMKKLSRQDDRELEEVRIRNEYVHFLRIMLLADSPKFYIPFRMDPPEGPLAPLPEALANYMTEKCSALIKTGPMRPILLHKSNDGRAYMAVKRCPEGGVFCYMSVSPHPLKEEDNSPI